MKKYFDEHFLSPWRKASITDKVLWLVMPIASLLSWLMFVMPYMHVDGLGVMGYDLVSGYSLNGIYVGLSGYKEMIMCTYLTIFAVFSMFYSSRLARSIQAGMSSVALALFAYFILLNDKAFTSHGFAVEYRQGLVWPIVICLILLVSSCILLVNAKKVTPTKNDESVKED